MEQALADRLTLWRRHLHAHPELSLQEAETAAFVCERLREFGVPFVSGIGGHGVVATLRRGGSDRCVGLRADMDALPIAEETGLDHASTRPGVMHACGHDGHTAALLGAVALLAADPDWRGSIHCIFQPAEEGNGGARAMIADGLFDRFPAERMFGFHNWPGIAVGTAVVHHGAVMAAGARVTISIEGRGGHAAQPHLTLDPMLAAAHLLLALQSVVSRTVDPLENAVLSICTMTAGEAGNQIPSRAVMRGTVRALRTDVLELVEASVHRIAAGIAQTFGVAITVEFLARVPLTRNTEAESEIAALAARRAGLTVLRDVPPA